MLHPGPDRRLPRSSPAARASPISRITSRRSPASRGGSPDWLSGGALAAGVDVLLHDSQYLDDEYGAKIGWGHSSVDDAVAYRRAVGADRLVLFHHEPERSDHGLELLQDRARELSGADRPAPELAREGMVIDVPSSARVWSRDRREALCADPIH